MMDDPNEDSFGGWLYDATHPDPVNPAGSGDNALTLNYYRTKVNEFQQVLYAMENTGRELYDSGIFAYASNNPEMIAEYETLWAEFDGKRNTARAIAEGIQLASQGINAIGIQFPSVQMPMGLGVIPLAPLAAAAGVIAAAAALIAWANGFWRTVQDYAQRWQHLSAIEMLPEHERAPALEQFRKLENAAKVAEIQSAQSPIAALATFAKWGAIGLLGIMAFKAWKESR
jgi:hypothetical protein